MPNQNVYDYGKEDDRYRGTASTLAIESSLGLTQVKEHARLVLLTFNVMPSPGELLTANADSVDLTGASESALLTGSQLIPRLDSGNTVWNRMDKGSSCISQVELSPSLFTINLPFGNAVKLKKPGFLEELKSSFLPAFGEAPHLPSR